MTRECPGCKQQRAETLFGRAEDPCAYCMAGHVEEDAVPDDGSPDPVDPTKTRTAPLPKGAANAAKELAFRTLSRKHLLPFVLRFNPKYDAGWVHKDICQRLEKFSRDVADKKSPRLMLFMPPRHGKSTLSSIAFPAWHLGNYPDHEVISCSYSGSLAMKFSRKVRNMLRDPSYGSVFPACELDPDSQGAEEWLTTTGGGYVAAGVGGGITGKGAHCASRGTLIQTEYGEIAIEDLCSDPRPVKVLSYNTGGNYLEYRRIKAISVREGRGIYRVTTARGRVVETTGEHPFWTGEGYTRADSLSPGDRLMSLVPEGFDTPGVRISEGRAQGPSGPLLLPTMFKSTPRNQEQWTLPYMQLSGPEGEKILRKLQKERPQDISRVASTVSPETDQLPHVQYRVYGATQRLWEVRQGMQQDLRPAAALPKNVGDREPKVSTREHAPARAAAFGESLPHNETLYQGEGQSRVRSMPFRQGAARTPHRLLADEQRVGELSDPMFELPPAAALGLGLEAAEDSVAMVERVREIETVYDLEIEENHNFFAGNLLVSNCLIIDDPVKNREDAESPNVKESVQDWYTSTAYTRLAPGGGILLIMTRWADDDLAGWLLSEMKDGGEEWEVVKYPAIAEEDELYRDKGDPLHPERYDLAALKRIERAVGPRDWPSLFQQNPVPDTGAYFNTGMIHYYDPKERDDKNLRFYQAWDLAIGKDDRNDYTVGITVGIDRLDNIYVVDVARGKWDGSGIVEKILDSYQLWKPAMVGIEKGHIEMAIGPFLQKRVQERKLYEAYFHDLKTGRRDKEARSRAIQGRMQQGKVFFPKGAAFTGSLVGELLRFPSGEHDDQVDALAWIGLMMAEFSVVPGYVKPKDVSWRDRLDSIGVQKRSRSAMSA